MLVPDYDNIPILLLLGLATTSPGMQHHIATRELHKAGSNHSTVNDPKHLWLVTVPLILGPLLVNFSSLLFYSGSHICKNTSRYFWNTTVNSMLLTLSSNHLSHHILTALLPICLSAYRRSASELKFSWLKLNLNKTEAKLDRKG